MVEHRTFESDREDKEGGLLDPGNKEERRSALSFMLLLVNSPADTLWRSEWELFSINGST